MISQRLRMRLIDVLRTHAHPAVILIRLMIGSIFVAEGIQKFLFPEALGAGRFAAIGIPQPSLTGPLVGTVETCGGLLILLGLGTRLAAVPLLVTMMVAFASTKIPVWLGHGYWRFADPAGKHGFWAMAHESRTDIAMLLGLTFLLVVGAGSWSLDGWLVRPSPAREEVQDGERSPDIPA